MLPPHDEYISYFNKDNFNSIEWDWIDKNWKLVHYTSQSNRPYYIKYAGLGLSIIMIELYEKSEITNNNHKHYEDKCSYFTREVSNNDTLLSF